MLHKSLRMFEYSKGEIRVYILGIIVFPILVFLLFNNIDYTCHDFTS